MKYRPIPRPASPYPLPASDEDQRAFLSLQDLVIEPIAFELSDLGQLPAELPPAAPPVH